MSDIDRRELAQLGLKHIEDAVVDLLTRHPQGLGAGAISEVLGLNDDQNPEQTDLIATGVLALLARSGRILRDARTGLYKDNPELY